MPSINNDNLLQYLYEQRIDIWIDPEVDTLRIFAVPAWAPHLAKEEHMTKSNGEKIIPHHVCWITNWDHHFSWNNIPHQSESKSTIFTNFSRIILADMQLLRSYYPKDTPRRFVTTFAVWYDTTWIKSPQSVQSIHVHNLIKPIGQYQKIATSEQIEKIFRTHLQWCRQYSNIARYFWQDIRKVLSEIFNEPWISVTLSQDSWKKFGQVTFDGAFKGGTSLEDLLMQIWTFYHQLKTPWSSLIQKTNSRNPIDTISQASLSRIQQTIRGYIPTIPSFNVILTWNEDYTRITQFSIMFAPIWPAERLNDAIIIRD